MPKDSLGVYLFKDKKNYTFPDLKLFSLPKENSRWVAVLTVMKKAEDKEKAKTEEKAEEKTKEEKGKAKTKESDKDKDQKKPVAPS